MTAKAAGRRFVAVLGAMALLGAACGQEESDLPDPPSDDRPELSQPVAPELTDEEQAAVDEVTALVDEFLALYQEILIEGEPAVNSRHSELPELGGLLLTGTWDEIDDNARNELRGDGAVTWEMAKVVEVDLDRFANVGGEDQNVPLVNLQYCVDATDWRIIDGSGEPVSSDESATVFHSGVKELIAAEATFYDPSSVEPRDNPQWRLREWEPIGGEPC
ncbi:hypothetical protein JQS43_15430 [Natronosporangium hydrolyticum]|uniref:Lipoprotein n=1 Tax=Natronosporangium hydrolyticum TaxID=2811111 RepID=A0A895YCI0_9ACTN|nr:hypothetical protein [Natronosporangium hydrolyticum]QSB13039.1 hypothetical protein JQS43_15430 [Natronosporangium hydrolyticum]